MLDAGLEPAPAPIAEIGLSLGDKTLGARRWALFVRSMLPKIVEYGLATEPDVDVDTLEWRLREEFLRSGGLMPVHVAYGGAVGAHANVVDDKKQRRRDTRTPNGSIDVELLLRHATK